jgi:hypothetical protein
MDKAIWKKGEMIDGLTVRLNEDESEQKLEV